MRYLSHILHLYYLMRKISRIFITLPQQRIYGAELIVNGKSVVPSLKRYCGYNQLKSHILSVVESNGVNNIPLKN